MSALRAPTGNLPGCVRGRDELLAQLRLLAERPDGRVHVLAGLGGVGKSTVALQIAEETAQLGRPVWWVPPGDAGTVAARLLGLAEEASVRCPARWQTPWLGAVIQPIFCGAFWRPGLAGC